MLVVAENNFLFLNILILSQAKNINKKRTRTSGNLAISHTSSDNPYFTYRSNILSRYIFYILDDQGNSNFLGLDVNGRTSGFVDVSYRHLQMSVN